MTKTPTEHPAVADLGPRGRRFWTETSAQYEFDAAEAELLVEACRLLDLIERLHAEVDREGTTTLGSSGQPVRHPSLAALHDARGLLTRVISALNIPAAEDTASTAGRALVAARWDRARRG